MRKIIVPLIALVVGIYLGIWADQIPRPSQPATTAHPKPID